MLDSAANEHSDFFPSIPEKEIHFFIYLSGLTFHNLLHCNNIARIRYSDNFSPSSIVEQWTCEPGLMAYSTCSSLESPVLLVPKGPPFEYSFVSKQIGPYGLAFKRKTQKNI